MALKKLKVWRDIRTERVTLGKLLDPDIPDFRVFTLERPWLENKNFVSCVPTGKYICELDMYYGGDGVGGDKQDYPAYELRDVPGRTEVKIHIGNYVRNVVGCIALGMSRDKNFPAVWESAKAYKLFMDHLRDHDRFELEIVDS